MPANPHPGNDYYVDTINGSIQRGYMAAQIRFIGHPIAGPFDWARAVQVANESNLNKIVIRPAKAAGKAAQAAGKAAETVGDFLGKLGQRHTWLRVAEVVIGVAALAIGLNALLHNPAGKVAKAVPKVVPV